MQFGGVLSIEGISAFVGKAGFMRSGELNNNIGNSEHVEFVVEKYSKMLFRICYVMLCNAADAEDVVQDTFVRYFTKAPAFSTEEHRKAWLIRVATNLCKNALRFRKRHETVDIEGMRDIGVSDSDMGIFEAIMELPPKYKIVMDLYYIEGYRIKEISDMTGATPTAIRKRLQYARDFLKMEFERDDSFEV